jgi:hypothetical protein
MFEFFDLIYPTFDFYAQLGSGNDLFSIGANSFTLFVRDAGLANEDIEGQRAADLQLMFDGANAATRGTEGFNQKRSLNRFEWLGVLAQLVLERNVKGRGMAIEAAVENFFLETVQPNLPAGCVQDSNSFRSDCCYTEEVDLVLKAYDSSLRNIYEAFAYGTGAIGDAVLSTKLLDVTEFNELVYRLDLIDSCLTQREVRLNFIWSRMMVIDEGSVKGRSSVLQLRYEDFLELVVRFAYVKALPTAAELDEAGASHAGEYLAMLSAYPEEEARFKQEHSRNIGEPLEQPLPLKVRQFIEWVLFAVRGGVGGACEPVTRKQADKFKAGHVARVRRTDSAVSDSSPNVFGDGEEAEDVTLVRDEADAPTMLAHDSNLRSRTEEDYKTLNALRQ